ncbi:MAG: hypothetical protein HETSPECPRED_002266 [Heterodermia speciosa]|uniref:RNA polymerase II-associated protein 1 C-terminal domain-containing protein n=1 Tax=Heterodermia speciosa TaxID=116794 RepID=A0A8H3EWX9_9LECA|nr:MAG: hypothetical protein HETSPECPRED_002266 [Heterodermia speciosa]
MAIRGQRFRIDLDSDSDDENDHPKLSTQVPQAGSVFSLVKDVQERVPSAEVKPPSPPKLKSSETGFPTHKRRTGPSAFKKGLATKPTSNGSSQTEKVTPGAPLPSQDPFSENGQPLANTIGEWVDNKTERQRISDENDQKLAQMSPEEIEEAQKELLAGLNPSIIEALMRKANIDDDDQVLKPPPPESAQKPKQLLKKVAFDIPEPTVSTITQDETEAGAHRQNPPPDDPHSSSRPNPTSTTASSSSIPDLDPSSPNFLTDLHSKYFPSLPADPSRLSWMQPLPTTSSYSPLEPSLTPSALRFDFQGRLLPPRLSAQLPSTKGLHHHSSAPGSAGYTIPELAHLARSTFPSQRCIAMQTLGRILYRLGRGDFGEEVAGEEGDDDDEEEGGGGALCEGLWNEMEKGRVIDGLVEAAGRDEGFKGGNRSVWVTATEAVWNWRKGGGRRLK